MDLHRVDVSAMKKQIGQVIVTIGNLFLEVVARVSPGYWFADLIANDAAHRGADEMEMRRFPGFLRSRSPWTAVATNRFATT